MQRCLRELPHQHKAFEQLVGAYKDMIYTLCYRMTGNAGDAEDLLQEILTKLFLGLNKFEGRSAFSSWLYRVAYNHCLNFLASRREERRKTDPLPERDVFRDPATETSAADERTQAVLDSLPPEERIAAGDALCDGPGCEGNQLDPGYRVERDEDAATAHTRDI